jgi:hypothetical protein
LESEVFKRFEGVPAAGRTNARTVEFVGPKGINPTPRYRKSAFNRWMPYSEL